MNIKTWPKNILFKKIPWNITVTFTKSAKSSSIRLRKLLSPQRQWWRVIAPKQTLYIMKTSMHDASDSCLNIISHLCFSENAYAGDSLTSPLCCCDVLLQEKNIFEHTYFGFVWQMASYVPTTLPRDVPDSQVPLMVAKIRLRTYLLLLCSSSCDIYDL